MGWSWGQSHAPPLLLLLCLVLLLLSPAHLIPFFAFRQWLLVKGRRRRRSRSSASALRWLKERTCLASVTSSPPSTTPSSMSLIFLESESHDLWPRSLSVYILITKASWELGCYCFVCGHEPQMCLSGDSFSHHSQGDHLPRDRWDEGEGRQRRVVSVRRHVGGSGRGSALQRAGNHCAAHQTESHRREQVSPPPVMQHPVGPRSINAVFTLTKENFF